MQNVRTNKFAFLIFSTITLVVLMIAWFSWYENEINRLEMLSRDLVDDQFEKLMEDSKNYSNELEIINSHWQLKKLKYSISDDEKKNIISILYEEIKTMLDLNTDYDQFRILEHGGMELLRIDRNGSSGIRSPDSELQDKSGRYYFQNVMKMKKKEIYYSPLDLNVEHGEIEIPYKPTMRFALPLNAPDPDFFLILNINFSKSLGEFKHMNNNVEIDSYLINREGYYLSSPYETDEWGFVIKERSDSRVQSTTPALWREIERNDSGLVHLGRHFYHWRNLYLSGEDSRWTILAEITPSSSPLVKFLIPFLIFLFLSVNTIFLLAMKNYKRKKMTLKNIVEKKNTLEIDLLEKKDLLRKAVYLQQSFIQKEIPMITSFNIHNLFMPCDKLGGDFFSIIKRRNGEKLIIVIGDCTDHGMKASMDASLLSRLVEQNIEKLYETDRTDLFLNEISKKYAQVADDDQFPTMLVLVININIGEMFYSNANSELPYIFRDNQLFRLKTVEGFHLGYFEEPEYEREHFVFNDKDRLFLFSDAVIDIVKADDTRLGLEGLEKIVKESTGKAEHFFKDIVDKLERENRKFPLDDDTTLILLEYKKIKENKYRFYTREEWCTIHNEIRELLHEYDYSHNEITNFCISIDELCSTTFLHEKKSANGKSVIINMQISCREIVLKIEDQYSHGRGIGKAENYFDLIEYDEIGSLLTLIKSKKQRKTCIM